MSAKIKLAAAKGSINAVMFALDASVHAADAAATVVAYVKRAAYNVSEKVADTAADAMLCLLDAERGAAEAVVEAKIAALETTSRVAAQAYNLSIVAMRRAQGIAESSQRAYLDALAARDDSVEELIG